MDFGLSQCCIQIDTTTCWSGCTFSAFSVGGPRFLTDTLAGRQTDCVCVCAVLVFTGPHLQVLGLCVCVCRVMSEDK